MRILLIALSLLTIARAELDLAPLEGWISQQKSMKTLDAQFDQERKLPSLKKPVTTTGRLRMIRPGKLLWELGDPVKTMAVSDGTTMTLVDVTKKRGKAIDANSTKARQFTLLTNEAFTNLEGFKEAFEPIESRVVSGIYQLTVKPKERAMRKQVAWVFLDIDTKTKELRALALELSDKSRIRTVFTKSKMNGKIDASVFTPDLSGYTIR